MSSSRITSEPRSGLALVKETKAKGKPVAEADYGKMTFKGVKNDGPSRNLTDRVGVAVRMAVVINSKDKTELVEIHKGCHMTTGTRSWPSGPGQPRWSRPWH
jgi:hypothetical protein